MASDDDDEMAQLRAQRRAALGTAGLTVTALRERQQRQQATLVNGGENIMPHMGPRLSQRAGAKVDSDDDEDDPVVVEGLEDEAVQYNDDLRAQFPMAFGEQEKAALRLEAVHAATVRQEVASSLPDGEALGALQPPTTDAAGAWELDAVQHRSSRASQGSESDEDENEVDDPYLLPITHEVSFEGHEKMVTALAVDKAGARVLTGGEDYKLRMFDFGGMKRDMRAFRTLEPEDSYPVNAVSFSPTGDAFLAVTGSSQPKIFDREGHELGQFVKGDMYIRDLKNTKGHQYRCCSGQWHPTDRHTAMSCAEDGSVRIWDTEKIAQKTVLKPSLARPGRSTVTACTYNSEGSMIAAGLKDGSIQIWDVRGKFARSAAVGAVAVPKAQMMGSQDWSYIAGARQLVRGAHSADEDITCLRFSADNNTLLSRSEDATLKVWDARKLKLPVKVFDSLPAARQASVCFSPDESLILTGTEAGRDGTGAALFFFDVQRLELVRRVAMAATVSALLWHERINQIFVGTGSRKAGGTRVLYDPSYSEKGVLLCAGRAPRAANPLDFELPLVIKNPHALPMYREDDNRGRKRPHELAADEAVRTKRPDPGQGVAGKGTGGKVGSTGGTILTQYILKNQGLMDKPAEEDIRAAILRHEGKTDDFTKFTDAYRVTQPKPIFAEEEVDEYLEKKD